ncbi:hypothetical protein Rmf_19120 [Roseomonas fluvialis]|uniref:Uncharacterized protein n=2 Tax=Roseomonas fluvialis TaxID=1750527 RepID=A0ABN6NZY5_9PROT|nr:hypothetical protein Rmf_19120 [Roseomonas fluvialis]
MASKKNAAAAPAPDATPAPAPAPRKITVLVEAPTLRGSRAARWSLITQAKDAAELATLLKDNGHKQTAAGTLRWLTEAKLIRLD